MALCVALGQINLIEYDLFLFGGILISNNGSSHRETLLGDGNYLRISQWPRVSYVSVGIIHFPEPSDKHMCKTPNPSRVPIRSSLAGSPRMRYILISPTR